MNKDAFLKSISWFSFGIILNRAKYILLTGIILQLGVVSVAVFYLSIHLVSELSIFLNRLISSSYNHYLRDEKFMLEKKNRNNLITSYIQMSVLFGILGSVLVYFLATPVSLLFKNSLFASSLRILSVSLFFMVILHANMKMLSLLKKFKEVVLFQNLLEAILILVGTYFSITYFGVNLQAAFVWQGIALFLSMLISYALLFALVPQLHFASRLLPVRVKISSVSFDNGVFLLLLQFVDLFIIGYFLGVRNLGLYFAFLVVPHLIYQIGTNLCGMFIHTASSFYNDKVRLTRFSQKVTQLIVFLLTFILVVLLVYPQETLRLLFIHSRLNYFVVGILSLGFFLRVLGWMGGQILIVTKKATENMSINLIIPLIGIPLFLVFVPRFGLVGVALIVFGLSVIDVSFKTYLAYTKAKISFISWESIKIMIIGDLIFLFSKYFFAPSFPIFLFYFPCIFVGLLLLVRGIEIRDFLLEKNIQRLVRNFELLKNFFDFNRLKFDPVPKKKKLFNKNYDATLTISIMIITKDRYKMLDRCLQSLACQTRKPDQIVVVDSSLTKNSLTLKKFHGVLPIRYVPEKKTGYATQRNIALARATGDIVAIIDDDAQATPQWCENILRFHAIFPKVIAIQGKQLSLPKSSPFAVLEQIRRDNCVLKNLDSYGNISVLTSNNISFKRKLLKHYNIKFTKNALYDIYGGEDIDLERQIRLINKDIIYVPSILVYHWERQGLFQYLKQQYRVGISKAVIQDDWKVPLPKRLFAEGLSRNIKRIMTHQILNNYFLETFLYLYVQKKIYHIIPILSLTLLAKLSMNIGYRQGKLLLGNRDFLS